MTQDNSNAPAGAPSGAAPSDDRFAKFFTMVPADTVATSNEAPADNLLEAQGNAPVEPTPAVEAAPVTPPAQADLAAKIRAEREARAARTAHETEAKTLRERLADAESRLAALTKTDLVADPLGWAEAQGLTPDERALLGESLLYSLVPDKATPEVRIRMMEAKQARAAKQAEQAQLRAQQEAQAAQIKQVHDAYVASLHTEASQVSPGVYPDSEAWFGSDRDSYTQSLYATANNMAELARLEGKVADLSFGAVAKTLESELNLRFSRRGARAESPKTQAVATPPGKQPGTDDTSVMSTKGTGAGPPRAPAKTAAERLQRAAEAAFRTK